jgi:protein-S-isoprenylcysteine O-methyltransferase Ste14
MKETQSRESGARVRFPPPFVFLAASGVGVGLQRFVAPLRLGLETSLRGALGGVIVCAGVALIAWAVGLFRRTGQDPAPWKPSPSMIANGPYRFTRNPMYVGMTLVQLGVGVAVNDLWIALLAPVALLGVHFIAVLPEEAYLSERFGGDYETYRAAVRRYL